MRRLLRTNLLFCFAGPLSRGDVLKHRAEQHQTRHGEGIRRDDALDSCTQVCNSRTNVVIATFKKNESITMMELASETIASLAQTNFRSTIAQPTSNGRVVMMAMSALYSYRFRRALA